MIKSIFRTLRKLVNEKLKKLIPKTDYQQFKKDLISLCEASKVEYKVLEEYFITDSDRKKLPYIVPDVIQKLCNS